MNIITWWKIITS